MSIPERGKIIAVSVLSDETLSIEVLDKFSCGKPGEPELHVMGPHMYGQHVQCGIALQDSWWCQNLSGPMKKLCQLTSGTYLIQWIQIVQQVTVVSLGGQDITQGIIDVDILANDPYLWVRYIHEYVDHLVEQKLAYYRKRGFGDVADKWELCHTWYIYPIPQLPKHTIEKFGKVTVEDYNKVRKLVKKHLKKPGVVAELRKKNVFLMKENVDVEVAVTEKHPDWRDQDSYKELYAAPIIRHLANIHCLRCKASLLHKAGWQSCIFQRDADTEVMRLNCLVDSDWMEILQYISVFDIFSVRQCCKAFYAKVHLFYRCSTPLSVEAERIKLIKKS